MHPCRPPPPITRVAPSLPRVAPSVPCVAPSVPHRACRAQGARRRAQGCAPRTRTRRPCPPPPASAVPPQWLWAVYQLVYYNATAFEFTPALLVYLVEHHNTLMYGTFLGNSDQERQNAGVYTDTVQVFRARLQAAWQ